jgi:regulator of sirC expression with transglutaminase-like and TPR domain
VDTGVHGAERSATAERLSGAGEAPGLGTVAAVDVTERFRALVHGPEVSLPLDEAALLIAAHAEPGLDLDAELARLDELAAGVANPTLDGLRRHLFGELGFRGADHDYDDPRNSYLHAVVERRVGIPISLSVLLMEVGRRIGVPLAGVSMPGHFLVRDKVDPEVFVDAFARGAELDRRGAQARFHAVHGAGARFDPDFLAPAGRRSIVVRMLTNLERLATTRGDRASLRWILDLRTAMPDAGVPERRRLAALLATTGEVVEAASLLEGVAEELTGDAAEAATAAARRLRAQLN